MSRRDDTLVADRPESPSAGGGERPPGASTIPNLSDDIEIIEVVGEAPESRPTIDPLIEGRLVPGTGAQRPLLDPSTGERVAELRLASPNEINDAVESAAVAATLWRASSFDDRVRHLEALAGLVRIRARALAEGIAAEQGKPVHEALSLEILPALDHLRFLIAQAAQFQSGTALESRHRLFAHKHAHYMYEPLGVVAIVTPSPLPFAVPLIQAAAALAMGNAVVIKPSEWTPRSALTLGELCLAAGFPAGLVNVVPALADGTRHLVAHPRVDKVFFTGGFAAGREVMAAAARFPRPVVLRLGGKHAAVVAADADVERTARGIAWGALANAGQHCGAVERVYVEDRIASRFVERLLAEVDRVQLGDARAPDVDLGPLVSDERRREVHRQVTEAAARGARVVRGGTVPEGPGFYYPPTVVLDPPPGCRLMVEETLGPVIPIVPVESLERAILLANESEFALSASGWTTSRETAEHLMASLRAGVVTINDALYPFGEPAATWSGWRRSGFGQAHGSAGLREMCRPRFVSFDGTAGAAPLFAFPYDRPAGLVVERAIWALHGRRKLTRGVALLRMLSMRRFRERLPLRAFLFGARHRR